MRHVLALTSESLGWPRLKLAGSEHMAPDPRLGTLPLDLESAS